MFWGELVCLRSCGDSRCLSIEVLSSSSFVFCGVDDQCVVLASESLSSGLFGACATILYDAVSLCFLFELLHFV